MFKKAKPPKEKQEVQSQLYDMIKTTVFYTTIFIVFGIIVGFLMDLVK